jgi:hypothetical protein
MMKLSLKFEERLCKALKNPFKPGDNSPYKHLEKAPNALVIYPLEVVIKRQPRPLISSQKIGTR